MFIGCWSFTLQHKYLLRMRKTFFVSLLFFLTSFWGSAQKNAGDNSWQHIYRGAAAKINDLVHTKLSVHFDYEKTYLYGKAWITIHPHFYDTDSLTLDAKGMDIHEVALYTDNKNIALHYDYDSLKL